MIRIIYSDAAYKSTDERLFPASRHRSRRIEKKLVKRFGGYYKREPAIFMTPAGCMAHPSLKPTIEAAFKLKADEAKSDNLLIRNISFSNPIRHGKSRLAEMLYGDAGRRAK